MRRIFFIFLAFGFSILFAKTCDISNVKVSEIPEWRSGYVIVSSTPLLNAPNVECTQNLSLESKQKIKVLGTSGEYLSISFKTNEKNGDTTEHKGFIKADSAKLSLINFDFYFTLVVIVGVLLLGRFIIARVKFLQDYNIPEPVVGGIIAAISILIIYRYFSLELSFDNSLKDPLMLAFFSSIGLSADFASLKKGGRMLFVFLVVVVGLLLLQNIIGVGVSYAMGVNPLLGMLGGSITMSGGHGTGAAWADTFKHDYGFMAATEVAMACATFGLIMGGIIGGPVARFLIRKHKLKIPGQEHNFDNPTGFETPTKERLITPISFIESLALIAICLLVGNLLSSFMKEWLSGFNLPTFVYCLFVGVVLRNVLSALNIHQVFDREVSVLGNVSLSLFLAFAMMTVNLWQLIALALPIIVILTSQTILMALYAIFVTFRFCGKDYDAAVLAAGHCGFGLGATPTAMVNMQTVTSHYGPSHVAFIIVPLVGAFFIDIINALVIQGTLKVFM